MSTPPAPVPANDWANADPLLNMTRLDLMTQLGWLMYRTKTELSAWQVMRQAPGGPPQPPGQPEAPVAGVTHSESIFIGGQWQGYKAPWWDSTGTGGFLADDNTAIDIEIQLLELASESGRISGWVNAATWLREMAASGGVGTAANMKLVTLTWPGIDYVAWSNGQPQVPGAASAKQTPAPALST